jgi:hypothetical protein
VSVFDVPPTASFDIPPTARWRVGATPIFDHDANGWRGAINLDFGLLPPIEYGDTVTYRPPVDAE